MTHGDALRSSTSITTTRLSTEQLAVARAVDTGRGNILVRARAGTGKTFLILQCMPLMRAVDGGAPQIAIVAFNRKIADEIEMKVRRARMRADVNTFSSFGRAALMKAYPDTKMEGKDKGEAGFYKFDRIAEELQVPPYLKSFVKKAMSMGMQRGIGIICALNDKDQWLALVKHFGLDTEIADDNVACQLRGKEAVIQQGIQLACKAVKLGITMIHEVMSFDDMLYMPLVLNCTFDQYDWVCVDEAQDSNILRQLMALRMTKPGGRRFWTGDDWQAINGFAGAMNDALDVIRNNDRCTLLPMTVTFRCGKAIVALAQTLVPDYQAAPTNAEGRVSEIDEAEFDKLALTPDDAIICRNTQPLIRCALRLIRRGIACHVEGRDIGRNLLKLLVRYDNYTLGEVQDLLRDHRDREVEKFMNAKQESRAEEIDDTVATIFALIEGLDAGATVNDLKAKIVSLFGDTKSGERPRDVTLMTAHKSKGLEFKRVFGWGNAKFFPSRFAKQAWQVEQEWHLQYVLWTRAIEEYVDVFLAA